jgi:Peptidase family M23
LTKDSARPSSHWPLGLSVTLMVICTMGAKAQAPPGPFEWIPLADPFICEAWFDLLPGSLRADWTGWTGSIWESPHAYNGHTGSDFSLETGTPIWATADGEIVTVVSSVPENTGGGYGNFVEIAIDGLSPLGQSLDLITAHMLPGSPVSVGQRVVSGQLIGHSDNTGNSTSEHCHVESSIRGGSTLCPFYNALFRYPILFNPEGTIQVGHAVRVTVESTPIRTDRFATSSIVSTAHHDQIYFASYGRRGFYRIFIPNDAGNRSGWVSARDVEEVFQGTVIQTLPDAGTYSHTGTLASPYPLRELPDAGAASLGQIVYGGGRFVADQTSGEWHRVPIPGAQTWGWVLPDDRMVVYPELHHPDIDPASLSRWNLPVQESFSVPGESAFGRPKFIRSEVQAFSPPSPGGDGYAFFLTDVGNDGDGPYDSVIVGGVGDRNIFAQVDIYFSYEPSQGGWERAGLFVRDDGFGGWDQTFEGRGNCYAITFDSDDGRLRAARIVDASVTDFVSPQRYVTSSGWHTLRIEALEDQITFLFDGEVLALVSDSTFPSGPCGVGFSDHTTSHPSDRGVYFDNFLAGPLGSESAGTGLMIH